MGTHRTNRKILYVRGRKQMIKTIRKIYYALFLVALAETEEHFQYAQNIVCGLLCEIKKKHGAFTINEHEQKNDRKIV